MGGNDNGVEGVTVLAAVLKDTQITHLTCAAALERAFAFVFASQHLCLLTRARSLRGSFGPEGGAALAEGLKGNSTLQVLK